MIILGEFKVGHQAGKISIGRADQEETFDLMPDEADTIKELIGDALRLESLPVLMPFIEDNPFRVSFHEDNTLSIEAIDGRPGRVSFSWREGDSLLKLMDEGKAIADNDRQMNKYANRPPWSPPNPTEPFN